MSVSIEANSDDVGAWLDGTVGSFNFERTGEDQSLGRDLAGVVAQGMIDRTAKDQKTVDGEELRPNEEKYRKRKRRLYEVDQPLWRTGQMLSLPSMIGKVTVSADQIEMRYGIGEAPTRSMTGDYISKEDKEITDVEKAGYVSEARPFYGLDDQIIDEVKKAAGEALGAHLKEKQ